MAAYSSKQSQNSRNENHRRADWLSNALQTRHEVPVWRHASDLAVTVCGWMNGEGADFGYKMGRSASSQPKIKHSRPHPAGPHLPIQTVLLPYCHDMCIALLQEEERAR